MGKFNIPQRTIKPPQRKPGQGVPSLHNLPSQLSMENDWSRFSDSALKQIQNFITDQKKVAGLVIVTAAGTLVQASLDIPQQGKLLLGFAFTKVVPQGSVSILLNNEKFVDNVNGEFFNVANLTAEFYYYPRPLTGVDKLQLEITDTAAQNVKFAAYYI